MELLCLVEGESASFSVKIEPTKRISVLKDAIKDKTDDVFCGIAARHLVLWRVSIPEVKQGSATTLDTIDDKTELVNEMTRLSQLFPKGPSDNTFILVQRPRQGNVTLELLSVSS